MIDFRYLDLSEDIKNRLIQYDVDFAFQPIFYKNGSLFGNEALMRPKDTNVEQLILYAKENNRLHDIELLSFFGATLSFGLKGLTGKLCINSIPSECLSQSESEEYFRCFSGIQKQLVVEMLENADYEPWALRIKESQIKANEGILVSIDDFGTGNNDITRVKSINPNIVKIDRSLITNLQSIKSIQRMVDQFVYGFHEMGILVLAEGIETQEEFDYLQTTEVDLYQGYYLGKPKI